MVEELSGTVDPNDIPTLIVYHRELGADRGRPRGHGRAREEIAEIDGVTDKGVISPNAAAALAEQGQQVPPLVSEDGQVAYLALTFNFGENGWNDIPAAADEIRDIAQIDGVTVHLAGFGGQAADAAEAFEGIDTNLIMITLLVVIVILLLTYRSPILWLLPIISAVVAYTISGGVVYLLAQVRRPDRQRAESGDPRHPGDRRRHRLCPPARRPLSRGAAPPRRPARSDGVRPPPGRAGDPGQRRDRRGRDAVPELRRAQLDGRPRPGPRRRRRRHLPGDGDAAPGACW